MVSMGKPNDFTSRSSALLTTPSITRCLQNGFLLKSRWLYVAGPRPIIARNLEYDSVSAKHRMPNPCKSSSAPCLAVVGLPLLPSDERK